jgi:hypothetical protein
LAEDGLGGGVLPAGELRQVRAVPGLVVARRGRNVACSPCAQAWLERRRRGPAARAPSANSVKLLRSARTVTAVGGIHSHRIVGVCQSAVVWALHEIWLQIKRCCSGQQHADGSLGSGVGERKEVRGWRRRRGHAAAVNGRIDAERGRL